MAFKVAWEIPYDKPEKLRPRLWVAYLIRIDSVIGIGEPPTVRLQRLIVTIPTVRIARPDDHRALGPAPRRRSRCRALSALAAGAAALAFVAAGCGSSGGGSSPSGSSSAGGAAATVEVKSEGTLGKILVDSHGRALYLFEKDSGPTSRCYQACARVWPPFTTSGKPKAGAGASASQLATTQRKDGKTQALYHGHPLYYYAPDAQQPGSTKGEGLKQFGAEWYVLSPAGAKVEEKGSGSSDSSSGGGGGY